MQAAQKEDEDTQKVVANHGDENAKVIKSSAEPSKGSGVDFRSWHYASASLKLAEEAEPETVCINTRCTITLVDREFLKRQLPDAQIIQRLAAVRVRGIGADHHETNEFILI